MLWALHTAKGQHPKSWDLALLQGNGALESPQ